MSSLFIFLVIIIFKADAWGPDNGPLEIIFKIKSINIGNGNQTKIICDHDNSYQKQKIYTVREEEVLKITTKHNSYIDFITCRNIGKTHFYNYTTHGNATTFKVQKGMGTPWKCTVLTNRDNSGILPVVHYKGSNYAAAYCYMKIHLRQTNSPQTILVNNMALEAARTDLSEKDVDFTAEYQYADGDVVNVTCINFLNQALLMMEYEMAGTMSDNSIMKELSSHKAIGFRVKLQSKHNNSYMTCTNTESTDYTKVMVRFVMRTEFNTVSVRINGMTLRPKLENVPNNYYKIEYKYESPQLITVVCEVQRPDVILVVGDIQFVGKVDSYKKTELIPKKKAEMSFYLNSMEDKLLTCASDYYNNGSSAVVAIHFTASNFPVDKYPLHMELPSNGTVMEIYSVDKLKVIFYEFEDGETLQLKCGPLHLPNPGPVLILQFQDSDICHENGCAISKTLHVTHEHENTDISCYLKEGNNVFQDGKVLREVRVILRERVLPTTSTTTSTASPVTALTTVITTTNSAADPASSATSNTTLAYYKSALGVAVFLILMIILYLSVKKCGCCKRSSSQELPPVPTPRLDPATVFYENLLAVFYPINKREAAEMEGENDYEEIDEKEMENHYEEIDEKEMENHYEEID